MTNTGFLIPTLTAMAFQCCYPECLVLMKNGCLYEACLTLELEWRGICDNEHRSDAFQLQAWKKKNPHPPTRNKPFPQFKENPWIKFITQQDQVCWQTYVCLYFCLFQFLNNLFGKRTGPNETLGSKAFTSLNTRAITAPFRLVPACKELFLLPFLAPWSLLAESRGYFYQPVQNQSSYTASIRPPQFHDSEYTKELDNSSLFLWDIITARCKKWIPVLRKEGPTHLREMSHWEREIPKPLAAFYSICRATVSRGGGLFKIHILQGLLRSLQRFTCPPAQDKGTTSQLKLRLWPGCKGWLTSTEYLCSTAFSQASETTGSRHG